MIFMMKKIKKVDSIVSKLIVIGGIAFAISKVIFWITYFLSDFIVIQNDFQNSIFSVYVNSLDIIGSIGLALVSIGLILTKKTFKVICGILLVVTPIVSVLLRLLPQISPEQNDFFFQTVSVTSMMIVLLTYVSTPMIFTFFSRPRSNVLISISVSSLIVWAIAMITSTRFEEVLGTRYGGFNSIDVYFTFIQLPFLFFIVYLVYQKKKSVDLD